MPAEKLTFEQTEFLIQFLHPEKILNWSTTIDERMLATIYGVDITVYRALREKFANRVRQAAQEFLGDAAFAKKVDKLPFAKNSVVVGLGDSITDDRQSWLEILGDLLSLRRPNDNIKV